MPVRDGFIRRKDGRHWKYVAEHKQYLLQCRGPCARYLRTKRFDKRVDGTCNEMCRACMVGKKPRYTASRKGQPPLRFDPSYHPEGTNIAFNVGGVLRRAQTELKNWFTMCQTTESKRLVCRTCDAVRERVHFEHSEHKGEFYRDCTTCRAKCEKDMAAAGPSDAPLDKAYRHLYPFLVDYGPQVTGFEILASPKLYPGVTYFHLTKEQRAAAVDLARKQLKIAA